MTDRTPIPPMVDDETILTPSATLESVGPWKLRDTFYTRDSVAIYNTTDPAWLVKVIRGKERAYDELHAVLELESRKIPHRVEVPSEPERFFGTAADGITWYAIRRYDGALMVNSYAKSHWRTVAINVLTFLQYFHTRCRKVHMDIKCPNILCDATRNRFVVGDYDLAGPVRPEKVARAYGPDVFWYYVAMGADPDQPLYSWRMDLTALGYMLASITWNHGENNDWTFYREALRRREGKGTLEISDAELIALREAEMSRVHTTMRSYLNLVGTLSWSAADPPSRDFYGELIRFFL
jgi:hypothetical protein